MPVSELSRTARHDNEHTVRKAPVASSLVECTLPILQLELEGAYLYLGHLSGHDQAVEIPSALLNQPCFGQRAKPFLKNRSGNTNSLAKILRRQGRLPVENCQNAAAGKILKNARVAAYICKGATLFESSPHQVGSALGTGALPHLDPSSSSAATPKTGTYRVPEALIELTFPTKLRRRSHRVLLCAITCRSRRWRRMLNQVANLCTRLARVRSG